MQRLMAVAVLAAALAVPALLSAQEWDPPYRGDGARILIGRSLQVPAGAAQRDAVVVVGGSLSVDGRVEDDVVVLGGRLRLGPTAVIDGDLTTLGAYADIDPQARIGGELNQVSANWPLFELPTDTWWWAALALVLTISRFSLVLIVSALVTLVAPRWTRDTGFESGHAPAASLLTGWAVQILFLPGVVAITLALAFSVIGIPLVAVVPLLFLALVLTWVGGFAGTAAQAGRAIRGRRAELSDPSPFDTTIGVVLFGLVTMVGHLMTLGPAWLMPAALAALGAGLAIEYVAWSIGLGAATRTIVSRWRGGAPLPRATLQPAQ